MVTVNRPAWMPDELAHAGSEHLDPGYVPGYDRKSGTDPSDDVEILRSLGLSDAHTVVDLGAGTGTFAIAIAPFCRNVIAVDVSAPMLGQLEAKLRQQGIDNVTLVQGGFLSYAHGGDPVDAIYSRHALHHLPDFCKAIAIRRMAAMLKPGGVLRLVDLVYSFEPGDAGQVFEDWFAGAAAHPEQGWTRAELETHVREEHSTFSWLLEPMLERVGFEIRGVQHSPSQTYSAYTCIKRP